MLSDHAYAQIKETAIAYLLADGWEDYRVVVSPEIAARIKQDVRGVDLSRLVGCPTKPDGIVGDGYVLHMPVADAEEAMRHAMALLN